MLAALTAQPMQATRHAGADAGPAARLAAAAVLGADLIARRPDVAAALARVEAANQQVASQRTQFYPDINFSAGFGLDAISLRPLPRAAEQELVVRPGAAPAHLRRRPAARPAKGKGADRDAAIQAYNQQVIDAVREAADAATSAASIGRQLTLQRQALDASTASYDFSQKRYGQGLGNALIVLNAETQMLAERRLEVDLEYRALDVQAQLMKALGGGWTAGAAASSTPPPPRPPRRPRPPRTTTSRPHKTIMNAPANNNAAPATTAPAGNPKRRTALTAIAVAVLVIGGGYGIYYWMTGRHSESTDNAYVQANVVQITAQAGGTVTAINADDTDFVKAGQLLVKLDPADARVALDQAEAALAQTVRETRILFANNSTLQAQIDARAADATRAKADLDKAQDDVNRRQPLVQSGAVGKEEFSHATDQLPSARSAYTAAKSALDAAKEQLSSNQSQTEGTSVADHPNVQRAAAKVREAWLAVQRADVPAPVTGTVARRSVQVGQRVQAGVPLMSVVTLDNAWVDANFKEGQLERLRIGQPATLEADVYGKHVVFHGKVAGPGRRHRRGVLAAAGAERHRQLDQGRAARARAHRARPEGDRAEPAARGPVDERHGQRGRRRRPLGGRHAAYAGAGRGRVDDGVRFACSTTPTPKWRASSRPTAAAAKVQATRRAAGASSADRRRLGRPRRSPRPPVATTSNRD